MIDNGHGCHTALHFGVKAKENQNKVLPKLHTKKLDLLLILFFLNRKRKVFEILEHLP